MAEFVLEKKKLLVDPSFENFNCLQTFLQDSTTVLRFPATLKFVHDVGQLRQF